MLKLSEKTIIFISVVFAICFLSLLWFLNQKNQTIISSVPASVSPTIFPIVVPTKPADPTANWKTYKNDKLGFSLNYPSLWQIYEAGQYQGTFVDFNNQKCEKADPSCVENEMGGNCPSSPACEVFEVRYMSEVKTVQELFKQNKYYKNIKQTTFANFPAYKSTYTWLSTDGSGSPKIDVQVGEKVYEISYGNEDLGSETQQILSTFKFTDNTQTVKIYYHNPKLDPNFENIVANDFKEVSIPKSSTPLKDSINELIKTFISEDEKTYGSRVTNFKLKSATIINGVAKLVFNDPESYTSGGSTRVNLIYSQIEKTALQFPSVKKVEITGAVFQP